MLRLAVFIMWFTCMVAAIIEGDYHFAVLFALAMWIASDPRSRVL